MRNYLLISGLVFNLLLAGCGITDTDAAQETAENISSRNLDLLDQEIEEITDEDWNKIHVSKKDFDLFLEGLSKKDGKNAQRIAAAEMNGNEITLTLNNEDRESLGNLFTAPFMDSFVRRVYIHSSYYNGEQPMIRVIDSAGVVLNENDGSLDSSETAT